MGPSTVYLWMSILINKTGLAIKVKDFSTVDHKKMTRKLLYGSTIVYECYVKNVMRVKCIKRNKHTLETGN